MEYANHSVLLREAFVAAHPRTTADHLLKCQFIGHGFEDVDRHDFDEVQPLVMHVGRHNDGNDPPALIAFVIEQFHGKPGPLVNHIVVVHQHVPRL